MRLLLCTLALSPCLLPSQDRPGQDRPGTEQGDEPAADVAARVRDGGTLFPLKWRRGADGRLEVQAVSGSAAAVAAADAANVLDPASVPFVPLVEFRNAGFVGSMTLVSHGNGDLLSMTDAEFHLRCLGIGTTDVELRQFLAVAPAAEGDAARAATFDRMVAVDLLRRRGCKPAIAELQPLAADAAAPAELRERARAAAATLHGETTAVPRRRLDPETMPLPMTFDGALVIDNARLPDMSWLTATGRLLGMAVSVRAWERVGSETTAWMRNAAQRGCDVVSELPFDLALRYGNARIDHTCWTVTVRADDEMPIDMQIQAAGQFDAERGARAAADLATEIAGLKERGARANMRLLPEDALVVTPELVQFRSTKGTPRPRPAAAKELLEDTGAALRVVIPQQSRLWPMLLPLGLPPASGADLRVHFGETCTVSLRLRGRDEDAADAWVERGKAVLAQASAETPPQLLARIEKSPEVKLVLDALANAQFSTEAEFAIVAIELRGLDRRGVAALAEQLLQ